MCHRQRGRELASSVINIAKLSMTSCMEGESESEEHLFLSEQVLSMFTCLQKRGKRGKYASVLIRTMSNMDFG